LAWELHDGAIQELVALRYQLAAVTAHAEDAYPRSDLTPRLNRMTQHIAEVVAHVRDLVDELRPTGLEDSGLRAALENFVSALRQEDDPFPEITVDVAASVRDLPKAVALCLFRVSQEAVRNAHSHAGAHHVEVRLRPRATRVILRISDDGRGFSVPEHLSELTQANHFGLAGMAERVALVQGRLRVRSRPGKGTIVTVWAPLWDGQEERARMAAMIRVLLADDHPLVREGVRAVLALDPDLAIVEEASSGDETQRLSAELRPDVVLLDLSMPGPAAADTVNFLHIHAPQTPS